MLTSANAHEHAAATSWAGLPNLIGIGVPKAGTTWLYELLDSHPDVWMSSRREISYFHRHYHRGPEWYRRFFPRPDQAKAYRVIGEISPRYLYTADNARKMAEFGSVERLLLILRNPVDRAYSDYWFRVRIKNYRGTFEQFLEDRPEAFEFGFYDRYLPAFFEYFDRSQILILLFERAIADISATRQRLASFLGIDVARFTGGAGERRVNERFVARWPSLYTRLVALGAYLRRHDVDWPIHMVRRLGLIGAVGNRTGAKVRATMTPQTRQRLLSLYEPGIDALQKLLQTDLSLWRR